MPVFTTCNSSEKPRCIKYDFDIEKIMMQSVEYFEVNGCYLDFDSKVFGEATETMIIKKFYEAKQIKNLSAFFLEYHEENMREQLIACGQKFVSMMSSHHCFYDRVAFYQVKQDLKRISVKGRIMIDAPCFRKNCLNYPRLHIKKPEVMDLFTSQSIQHSACQSHSTGVYTYEKVLRIDVAEFAVSDVQDIKYFMTPFNSLVMPAEKKKVIMTLAESVNQIKSARLDNVIAEKGLGVIILLHGPSSVGKTLTAEAIAEHQQRPLYSVSADKLSTDAGALEIQLSQIFQITSH
ncbi:hypothetical protein BDBG_04031 [Blastomyces gilchristii SLH14081]|uniref:Uncharacterized protein n=1 Tax=Blastomyces gilchristii (strain SLH14081) TaxID=559298 RepID=A0A179UJ66_BLAGS|nr:uncharacterized protein BDBG_04031 [Blastomyces gilchristii SLH14081]OAT08034.1 hypothetical protein BDBG_04031 [Blastomyces gilchristii SLH14081]